jgi:hypothetical protein
MDHLVTVGYAGSNPVGIAGNAAAFPWRLPVGVGLKTSSLHIAGWSSR